MNYEPLTIPELRCLRLYYDSMSPEEVAKTNPYGYDRRKCELETIQRLFATIEKLTSRGRQTIFLQGIAS